MFITIEELHSIIYEYQLQQITQQNQDIAFMAIATAEQEVKSYLTPNAQKHWQDGRLRYDVALIFSKKGINRNPLLVQQVKTVAVWYLCQLSNPDIIYENIKERYDRVIDYLKQVALGSVTLDLPLLTTNKNTKPFRFASRKKFNHE